MIAQVAVRSWMRLQTQIAIERAVATTVLKENIHDNMTNAELVSNMLGELATTQISKTENLQGYEEL